MSKRIVVIGGGPGGYVAAIRAAQLGAETHIVEAERFGGTCLNVGCIPTKAMLHTAELYHAVKRGAASGVKADNITLDWNGMQNNKQRIVNRLVKGVEALLKANKVSIHQGQAVLKNANTVSVTGRQPVELTADAVILAVGSEPVRLAFPGSDLPGVIDSTGALGLPQIPASLVIIGGGVIGVEFAFIYNALGAKVTVVELLPQILPPVDREIAAKLKQQLAKNGVEFLNEARLTEVKQAGRELIAVIVQGDTVREIAAENVLVAVGRAPRTKNIGLEAAGVAMERGKVLVDAQFATSVPGVYAIGDCNGQMLLAHAASAQGIAAVEHILGYKPAYFPQTIPSCIYTNPEVGFVGLTEEAAIEQGIACKIGRFPLGGNGKALIENGGFGMVKILADGKHGEILGVHIIGPRATDLIAEAALAIRLKATVDELVSTIRAHPTVSEAVGEAAQAVNGLAIHWPPGMKVQ